MYKDYQPFYDVGNPSPQSPLICKGSKWSHFLYVIRVLYIPRSHLFQKQKGEVCHWHAILRVKLRLPETFSDEKIVLAPKILLQHMKTKRLFHIIMQYFPWYVSMFKSIVCPCDVNTVWIVCDKPKANWHKRHEIDRLRSTFQDCVMPLTLTHRVMAGEFPNTFFLGDFYVVHVRALQYIT